jgi:hypothetical protein
MMEAAEEKAKVESEDAEAVAEAKTEPSDEK